MRDWRRRVCCRLVDAYAAVYVRFNPITPIPSSRLTPQVHAVKTGQVNFFVYTKDGGSICIDTGFAKPVIARELAKLGLDPGSVSHIFLTHTDFDHAGGVALFPRARVHLSRDEEVLINGTRARKLGLIRNRLPPGCNYRLLEDNDVVWAGGIKVRAVATPGHTPGSMSYLVDDACLFTGDAFRILDGRVRPIRPILTMDRDAELRSIRKLARLPGVELVFTAHRGFADNYDRIMADYPESPGDPPSPGSPA